jgi:ABC-type uncharacterized transport system substrate-binding protein
MKGPGARALALPLALVALLAACRESSPKREAGAGRVFYVNSYHRGYGSSDDVMAGLLETLDSGGVTVQTAFLDAKNRPGDLAARSAQVVEAIRASQPDVLVVSDDAAVQQVVVPHFRHGPLPVVFCGVNWSAEPYGLPTPHVTGMIEVVPILETLEAVREVQPAARRLFVLSEDTLSERSNREHLDPLLRDAGWEVEWALVPDYASWKDAFVRAQEGDVVYLPTNGAVAGWDEANGTAFVREQIRRLVVTCDDFMMPYAVFGATKVAREQGEWAGRSALAILAGTPPGDIPLARNSRTRCLLNADLASRVGFEVPAGLANDVTVIDER